MSEGVSSRQTRMAPTLRPGQTVSSSQDFLTGFLTAAKGREFATPSEVRRARRLA